MSIRKKDYSEVLYNICCYYCKKADNKCIYTEFYNVLSWRCIAVNLQWKNEWLMSFQRINSKNFNPFLKN